MEPRGSMLHSQVLSNNSYPELNQHILVKTYIKEEYSTTTICHFTIMNQLMLWQKIFPYWAFLYIYLALDVVVCE